MLVRLGPISILAIVKADWDRKSRDARKSPLREMALDLVRDTSGAQSHV